MSSHYLSDREWVTLTQPGFNQDLSLAYSGGHTVQGAINRGPISSLALVPWWSVEVYNKRYQLTEGETKELQGVSGVMRLDRGGDTVQLYYERSEL